MDGLDSLICQQSFDRKVVIQADEINIKADCYQIMLNQTKGITKNVEKSIENNKN